MAVYVINEVEILDPAGFEEYRLAAPATVAAFGGRYLARGGAVELLEGDRVSPRVVVLEFESMATAKAWLDSAEYKPAREVRHRTARTRMIAVQGLEAAVAAAAKPVDVFFYGLFMDPAALRARGLQPIDARLASVPGMALQIGERATLVRDSAERVYGMLIGLTPAELERLYAEPSVAAYRPEAVLAQLAGGTSLPALCYTLPQAPEATAGNADYAEKLRAVAARLGLPPDYVAAIG
jgi:uncharacterized protein (DUF1330 family)